jgi:hypothetical protein
VHLFEAQPRQARLERCLGNTKLADFSAYLAGNPTVSHAVTGHVPAYVTGDVTSAGTGWYASDTRAGTPEKQSWYASDTGGAVRQ